MNFKKIIFNLFIRFCIIIFYPFISIILISAGRFQMVHISQPFVLLFKRIFNEFNPDNKIAIKYKNYFNKYDTDGIKDDDTLSIWIKQYSGKGIFSILYFTYIIITFLISIIIGLFIYYLLINSLFF